MDAWQTNALHYFVFEMPPKDEKDEGSFALFTMRWEDDGPVSAVAVRPDPGKNHAEVVDVRRPDVVQHVPLSEE